MNMPIIIWLISRTDIAYKPLSLDVCTHACLLLYVQFTSAPPRPNNGFFTGRHCFWCWWRVSNFPKACRADLGDGHVARDPCGDLEIRQFHPTCPFWMFFWGDWLVSLLTFMKQIIWQKYVSRLLYSHIFGRCPWLKPNIFSAVLLVLPSMPLLIESNKSAS